MRKPPRARKANYFPITSPDHRSNLHKWPCRIHKDVDIAGSTPNRLTSNVRLCTSACQIIHCARCGEREVEKRCCHCSTRQCTIKINLPTYACRASVACVAIRTVEFVVSVTDDCISPSRTVVNAIDCWRRTIWSMVEYKLRRLQARKLVSEASAAAHPNMPRCE